MGSKNMTIQRAREILGSCVANLTDQEVTNVIYEMGQMADIILDITVNTYASNPKMVEKVRARISN